MQPVLKRPGKTMIVAFARCRTTLVECLIRRRLTINDYRLMIGDSAEGCRSCARDEIAPVRAAVIGACSWSRERRASIGCSACRVGSNASASRVPVPRTDSGTWDDHWHWRWHWRWSTAAGARSIEYDTRAGDYVVVQLRPATNASSQAGSELHRPLPRVRAVLVVLGHHA